MNKIGRPVVVCSPNASGAKKYEAITSHLKKVTDSDTVPAMVGEELSLRGGDTVFACGGDGTAQWVLEQVINSGEEDVSMVVAPCGHANDWSRELNGTRGIEEIISSGNQFEFSPLELTVDGSQTFYVGSYAAAGLTAIAAKWLNRESTRRFLPRSLGVATTAVFALLNPGTIKEDVDNLESFSPDVHLNGQRIDPTSFGFLLGSMAFGTLGPPGGYNFMKDKEAGFFMQYQSARESPSRKGVLGRVQEVGRWAARRQMPGRTMRAAELEFQEPATILWQVAGNPSVLRVNESIIVERSPKTVKITAF
jgi:hypothetical protein